MRFGRLERAWRALATPTVREHAMVSALFVIDRAMLHRAGMRLNLILDWMHQSDPEDLRTNLFHTLWYSHAYPPGMNLLTGAVLKIGGGHPAPAAYAMLYAFGLVLVNSLYRLLRISGLSYGVALVAATAFSLIPQAIYFEHLYLYTYPTAALLCLSAVFFHRAIERSSIGAHAAFFATCAAIGWLRSTFHLVWFAAMIGLALLATERESRRRVLIAAAGPAAALVALYLKNWVVFGVFGAMTFGSGNLTTVTVRRMPAELREQWVQEGKLSRFALVDIFDGPRSYLPYFGTSENSNWPPMMNRLEEPSLGNPNYNHWFFLDVNRYRRADAEYYLTHRPLEYADTVVTSFGRFFGSTTEWHPHDKTERSPHYQHRQVLGGYESLYNRFVHALPPIGLYALLPFAWVAAAVRARLLVRGEGASRATGWSMVYCLFQIAFVLAMTMLVSYGDTARYRFEIESLIWVVIAIAVAATVPLVRGWRRGGSSSVVVARPNNT